MKWISMEACASLLPSEAWAKRQRNIDYLMRLKDENLLFPYYWQAGLTGSIHTRMEGLHSGWDAMTSHIRGTFTAHFLSAAAYALKEEENIRLRARLNYLVEQIRICQKANGNGWCFPIPPTYVTETRDGAGYWAPLYVCHKVLMGLTDAWQQAGIDLAWEIIQDATPWFLQFMQETSRAQLTSMMDRQETGGLMECWAELYAITGNRQYEQLMRFFERPTLYEYLLSGRDALTNMHANTTIPEIHGAARAYEVTGEERYRRIVEAYWEQAVVNRGQFATGGQTSGEVWTPPFQQANRLGDQNQEHCVVYNMIRLADYLFRWTGESSYADYIEKNIWNGIFAQGHWEGRALDQCGESAEPDRGLISYYLPLAAGSKKAWGSDTDHCWCCHCTLMQAHSRLRQFIFYKTDRKICVAQYLPCKASFEIDGQEIVLEQMLTDLGGSCNALNETALNGLVKPSYWSFDYTVTGSKDVSFSLSFRMPAWLSAPPELYLHGEKLSLHAQSGWVEVMVRGGDCLRIILPKRLQAYPLPDEQETVAFLDGPIVLAGLVKEQRELYGDVTAPETFLRPSNERIWSLWTDTYRTVHQPVNFYFKPLYQIGREEYTVYFPVQSYR